MLGRGARDTALDADAGGLPGRGCGRACRRLVRPVDELRVERRADQHLTRDLDRVGAVRELQPALERRDRRLRALQQLAVGVPSLARLSVQGPDDAPVAAQGIDRRAEGARVAGLGIRGQLLDDGVREQPLLPGAHHERIVRTLRGQPGVAARLIGDVAGRRGLAAVVAERPLAAGHQVPERRGADRVGDQVDALVARRVEHVVEPPGVEDPGLAGGHVDRALVAGELDHGAGQDRDVDADPVGPVVVGVDVERGLRLALEAHQPRAPEDGLEARQHLAQVLALLQMRRRQHRPRDTVVHRIAVERDQRQGGVARMALRMRAPVRLRYGLDLGAHALDVEGERQLDELRIELHGSERPRGGSSPGRRGLAYSRGRA